jgi:hypothetical protein
MRRTFLVLTLILCAPTAAMALTAGPAKLGSGAVIHQGQITLGGVAESSHEGVMGGNVILAKGDQSGSGPGAGGHKGAHKGEGKGGQAESKAKGKKK